MSKEIVLNSEFDPESFIESQNELLASTDPTLATVNKMGSYFQLENQKLEFALYQYKRMLNFCLDELQTEDIFKYSDKAYINANGIDKFRGPFGLTEKDKVITITYANGTSKTTADPDYMKGEFKYIVISGTIRSERLGTESPFIGGTTVIHMNNKKTDGNNLHHLKTADTNWFTRAAKKLLGLNSVSWDKLKNIKKENCQIVALNKEDDPEFIAKADEMWARLLELNHGDIEAAEKECITYSCYVKKDGTPGGGKPHPHELTKGELNIASNKVNNYYLHEMKLRDKEGNTDKLKAELRELYNQEKEMFESILIDNGYTLQTLKDEKNEVKLNALKEAMGEIAILKSVK